MNRIGPNSEPCGTPVLMLADSPITLTIGPRDFLILENYLRKKST